jgi:hypothetical protein
MKFINLQHSLALKSSGIASPIGLIVAKEIDSSSLSRNLSDARIEFLTTSSLREGSVLKNIGSFEEFFQGSGFTCPLRLQFEQAQSRGISANNPLVDSLLWFEMATGVLMGAQDLDRIEGDMTYDIVGSEQSFDGMRGVVNCRIGEIVLTDEKGIIAPYFQGPDRRTKITRSTTSLLFFVFSTPKMGHSHIPSVRSLVRRIVATSSKYVEWVTITLDRRDDKMQTP